MNEQIDYVNVPGEFVNQAAPNGKLAPNLARRGVQLYRTLNADAAFTYFNMEDPVLGGYTPERIALRRAIALAMDVEREIRLVRRNQAIAGLNVTRFEELIDGIVDRLNLAIGENSRHL